MKNKTLPIILLLFWLITSCLSAQNGKIRGIVTEIDGTPLMSVTVKAGSVGTTTDIDGRFEINLSVGNYDVTCSYIGYEPQTTTVDVIAGKATEMAITMQETQHILQTATVTSGRYEKPLSETTVSIEVLKPSLIDNTNTTSISQVIDKVPGVNMIDGQPNIRGGSGWSYGAGSRVLVLVDDIPILQADAGLANWTDIPVESVGQVEVVKGAASALYGSSAMNGIINVRTAYAKDKPITKFAAFYTSFLDPKDEAKIWWDDQPYQFGGSLSHRQKFGKFDLVLGGFYRKTASFREYTRNRYGRFNIGTRYRLTDRLSFGINANINSGKSQSYFYWLNGEEGAYRANENEQNDELSERTRYNIDPFITYFDNDGNRHKFNGRFFGVDNNNTDNQSNKSDLYYGEYQFQRKFDGIGLVATAGLVGIYTDVSAELYGDTTFTSNNLAGYLQLEKKIDQLTLSGGVRYERNQQRRPAIFQTDTVASGKVTESKPVFRLGANYQAAAYLFLRASFGQGYRYPTIAERFITTEAAGLSITANPGLDSETGWSAEIAAKQGFSIGNFKGFVDVAAFWSEYQDMIEFNIFPTASFVAFQARNVGDTRIRGFEVSVAGQGKIGEATTTLLAGYTYIDPKFKDFDEDTQRRSSADHNVLKYRYKHNVKFDFESTFTSFSIGATANYTSRMEAIDNILTVLAGIGDYIEENDGGVLQLGARISYRPFECLKFSLLGNNLLNKEYTLRPGLLEAPINITGRVDYEF